MSRNRTIERRKEREQQRKRQRQFTILGGIVAVALLLGFIFLISSQHAEAPILEESLARYEGIPQSKNDQGFPVLGDANAPVNLIEYSSFACSACKSFHDESFPSLVERVKAGEVRVTYVPMYSTGGITNGLGAARAAVCAGEQDQFWAFHDALFDWQGIYVNTAFSENRLETGITNLGIDRAQWDACMAGALPGTVVEAAEQAAKLQNISSTPTVVVNGTIVQSPTLETVNQAIDAALAGAPAGAETTPEATAEATNEVVDEATPTGDTEATAEATIAAETEVTAEATASS